MEPKRSHHAKSKPHMNDGTSMRIDNFFLKPPPPPQVGRPPILVPPKKRGRQAATPSPAEAVEPPTLPEASEPKLGMRAAADMVGVKLKRINWGKGAALERLTKAVHDWDNKTGAHLEDDPDNVSLLRYAKLVDIPYNTLFAYAKMDTSSRKQLGISAGKQPLFNKEDQQFAVDVVRRHDRGNDGLCKRRAIDVLHDMKPDVKRSAVRNSFDRTIRPHHADVLTGIVKANPTTVKRTAITVPQQYRWHLAVEQALTTFACNLNKDKI